MPRSKRATPDDRKEAKSPEEAASASVVPEEGAARGPATEVWACGANSEGELGVGDTKNRKTPTEVTALHGHRIHVVACGSFFAVAVVDDGELWATGCNIQVSGKRLEFTRVSALSGQKSPVSSLRGGGTTTASSASATRRQRYQILNQWQHSAAGALQRSRAVIGTLLQCWRPASSLHGVGTVAVSSDLVMTQIGMFRCRSQLSLRSASSLWRAVLTILLPFLSLVSCSCGGKTTAANLVSATQRSGTRQTLWRRFLQSSQLHAALTTPLHCSNPERSSRGGGTKWASLVLEAKHVSHRPPRRSRFPSSTGCKSSLLRARCTALQQCWRTASSSRGATTSTANLARAQKHVRRRSACWGSPASTFSQQASGPGSSLPSSLPEKQLCALGKTNTQPRLMSQRVCRYWAATGTCPYGDGCAFSHALPTAMVSHSTSPAPPSLQQQQQQQTQPQRAQSPAMLQQTLQAQMSGGRRPLRALFVSDALRHDLLIRASQATFRPAPEDPSVKGLPPSVHRYHSLVRMDASAESSAASSSSSALGFATHAFRCVGTRDGETYLLRQVENVRSVADAGKHIADAWQRLRHPALAGLCDVFISSEVGAVPSLFAAYEFVAGSQTLESALAAAKSRLRAQQQPPPLAEDLVWSAAAQLLAALGAVHARGLCARGAVAPSKVLVCTSTGRFRLNCCGLVDIVRGGSIGGSIEDAQQDDLSALGRLLLALALQSLPAWTPQGVPAALDQLARTFSQDLVAFVAFLISSAAPDGSKPRCTVQGAAALMGPRLLDETSRVLSWAGSLEDELTKELQNGRIVRLLAKLGFVAQRMEAADDPTWSEAGDHYLLRIFRDHIFSCTPGAPGQPVLYDLAHMVDALNKVDAGSAERLVLLSHDDQTAFVVTYADIKRLLEEAFARSSP